MRSNANKGNSGRKRALLKNESARFVTDAQAQEERLRSGSEGSIEDNYSDAGRTDGHDSSLYVHTTGPHAHPTAPARTQFTDQPVNSTSSRPRLSSSQRSSYTDTVTDNLPSRLETHSPRERIRKLRKDLAGGASPGFDDDRESPDGEQIEQDSTRQQSRRDTDPRARGLPIIEHGASSCPKKTHTVFPSGGQPSGHIGAASQGRSERQRSTVVNPGLGENERVFTTQDTDDTLAISPENAARLFTLSNRSDLVDKADRDGTREGRGVAVLVGVSRSLEEVRTVPRSVFDRASDRYRETREKLLAGKDAVVATGNTLHASADFHQNTSPLCFFMIYLATCPRP